MTSLKDKDVTLAFFTRTSEDEDIWECRCGSRLKQTKKAGYGNLAKHVKFCVSHEGWEDDVHNKYLEAMRNNVPAGDLEKMGFVADKKGLNAFRWLEWIVMKNLPFSFVEDELTKNSVLKDISYKTFMKYLQLTTKEVELCIEKSLADKGRGPL